MRVVEGVPEQIPPGQNEPPSMIGAAASIDRAVRRTDQQLRPPAQRRRPGTGEHARPVWSTRSLPLRYACGGCVTLW